MSGSRTTETAVPLVIEFSGYRIEFDRPPAEEAVLTVRGSKMTVGAATRHVEK